MPPDAVDDEVGVTPQTPSRAWNVKTKLEMANDIHSIRVARVLMHPATPGGEMVAQRWCQPQWLCGPYIQYTGKVNMLLPGSQENQVYNNTSGDLNWRLLCQQVAC
jgi:hypothetical protein